MAAPFKWDPTSRDHSPHHSQRCMCTHTMLGSPFCWKFSALAGICVLNPLRVYVCMIQFNLSVVSDSASPWTVTHQAPLSMEFSRQEYSSGLISLLQEICLTQGSNLCLLHWQADSLPLSPAVNVFWPIPLLSVHVGTDFQRTPELYQTSFSACRSLHLCFSIFNPLVHQLIDQRVLMSKNHSSGSQNQSILLSTSFCTVRA